MSVLLLWLNLVLSAAGGIAILLRRTYPVATWLFALGLFALAGLCWVDLRTLQQPERLLEWRRIALALELVVIFCTYYYTKTAFRDNSEIYKGPGFWISLVLALGLGVYVTLTPVDHLIFSPDFAEERILFLTRPGFGLYLLLMLYLVFGLVQLERTLAGLHQLQRWNIKLEVIGAGLLLAGFALYFSQSLLYRSINLDYLGLRSLALAIAVALFVAARLVRRSERRLALSRGIAHRSFVLLIVGGYLVVLGAVGEGLRYFHIENAQSIFYALLLLGSLALAVLFLSEKLRRKLIVILHKNFYQSKYDYRDQWQKFAEKVSSGTTLSEIQSSLLDLFCETLACKGAVLYLQDGESREYQFVSAFNMRRDWRPFPDTDPLIERLQRLDWILNLSEPNALPDESLIRSMDDIDPFLVIPLPFDDALTGFIILGAQINPDEQLNYEDYDLLRMLARQSIAAIQGLRLSEQLTAAREMAAIGKVSTFVLHDLKNQVSGLSMMLDNAVDYMDDPEFQKDMLETVGNTVTNMKRLIGRLKNLKEKPELVIASVSLERIMREAAETAGGAIEIDAVDLQVAVDEEEIYKVLLNLLVNAREASPMERPVMLNSVALDGRACVTVSDTGCGMSPEFVEQQLFEPFVTTKKHGFGIGLYQCRQIIESHGGEIVVRSREGEGTTFTLLLPLADNS